MTLVSRLAALERIAPLAEPPGRYELHESGVSPDGLEAGDGVPCGREDHPEGCRIVVNTPISQNVVFIRMIVGSSSHESLNE